MRAALTNRDYMVEFLKYSPSTGDGGTNPAMPETLLAYLPEEIQLAFHSDYEPSYANMLNEGAIGFFNNLSRGLTGASASFKSFSQQLWIQSAPIDIQMQLVFDARDSASTDVMEKMEKLSRWVMPTRNGALLHSPSPTIINPESNRLSIRIGNFMFIRDMVLVSVGNAIPILPDSYGKPIAATCDVQMRTLFTPDSQDVKDFFGMAGLVNTDVGFNANGPLQSTQTQGQKAAVGDFGSFVSIPQDALANLSRNGGFR